MNEQLLLPRPSVERQEAERIQTETLGYPLRRLLTEPSLRVNPNSSNIAYARIVRRWHAKYAAQLRQRPVIDE